MNILVTGANGFIGKQLCAQLLEQGHQVNACIRKEISTKEWVSLCNETIQNAEVIFSSLKFKLCKINNIDANTDWSSYLTNVDVIIHLAGRVHVMKETAKNPLELFRKTNVHGTINLLQAAKQNQVSQFIYLSSIKVNGEETQPGKQFHSNDSVFPSDDYGQSKWEAEQAIKEITKNTNINYTILRPVLVYGPGVKANFFNLLRLIKLSLPLPFKNINNSRSMIYVDNLANLIIHTIKNKHAANETFIAADDEAISTTKLITLIANSMQTCIRLFYIPPQLFRILCLILPGFKKIYHRLTSNLEVDTTTLKNKLGWTSPLPIDVCIDKTLNWYNKLK